jgi:DNA polymerase-1
MLVQADANALEIRVAAYLSQDEVMLDELRSNKDLHTDNQTRLGLPSRDIAKTFVFRLLYGGSAYAFSMDQNFALCKLSEKKWQDVIDTYYTKYKGVAKWHIKICQDVARTGKLVMPTGRIYTYEPTMKRGERIWPRTTILNYPVQGLGADLMAIARVALKTRLDRLNAPEILLVNTVHDSIIVDCPEKYVSVVSSIMISVFEDIPRNFERLFGVEFNVPMKAEIQVGPDWGNMKVTSK